MTRRANGDGGLSWDKRRQRWIAATTVRYDGRGKRIVRRGSGRTKTEAKAKLRALLRDRDDGVVLGAENYTVGQAVEDWLAFGLGKDAESTARKYRLLCSKHIQFGEWTQQQKHPIAAVRVEQIDLAPGQVKPVRPPRAPGPAFPSRPC